MRHFFPIDCPLHAALSRSSTASPSRRTLCPDCAGADEPPKCCAFALIEYLSDRCKDPLALLANCSDVLDPIVKEVLVREICNGLPAIFASSNDCPLHACLSAATDALPADPSLCPDCAALGEFPKCCALALIDYLANDCSEPLAFLAACLNVLNASDSPEIK